MSQKIQTSVQGIISGVAVADTTGSLSEGLSLPSDEAIRVQLLLLHPDAFLERKVVFPDGHELHLPPPDRRLLSHEGIEFIEERGPSYLLGSLVLVTGQIHRATAFEKGFPIHYARVAEQWQQDPLIHDDQAIVMNVKAKGLVILTGCGHAGAIKPFATPRS